MLHRRAPSPAGPALVHLARERHVPQPHGRDEPRGGGQQADAAGGGGHEVDLVRVSVRGRVRVRVSLTVPLTVPLTLALTLTLTLTLTLNLAKVLYVVTPDNPSGTWHSV